jgi:APA family basic amino acid/polyamine antiporter
MDSLVSAAEAGKSGLARSLGPIDLLAIGIATIVGSGIFVLTGNAAAEYAGPGVAISFAIAGLAAGTTALCYAELASMIPVSGGTYSYAFAVLGPFLGWIIGWDLLLEYLFGGSVVAVGWSGYLENSLEGAGIGLPHDLANGAFAGGVIDVPAIALVAIVTALLVLGTRESATTTTVIVALKVTVLLLFVGVGAFYIASANLQPFVPANIGGFGNFGASGVVRAAGLLFFAFIGFDLVCTSAQEARNPRRTGPIGVLGSLGLATLLYIAVALVMTGLIDYHKLDVSSPLSTALGPYPSLHWLTNTIDLVALLGLGSTVLVVLYGQARILMRMGEDGLLPSFISSVSPRTRTPYKATIVCGLVAALIAGLLPITTLATLVSIGTLAAFIVVSSAVLVLRRTRPDLERPFKLPFGPVIPVLAVVLSLGVIATLPLITVLRFAVWLMIGLAIYFVYSRERTHGVIADRASAR